MTQITRDRLLQVLAWHVGEDNGVPIAGLADLCAGERLHEREREFVQRRIRKLVEELRSEGHHICATPAAGYYIAETPEELERSCRFLFDRAMTSLRQVAAMKRVSLPDLEGQLNLLK